MPVFKKKFKHQESSSHSSKFQIRPIGLTANPDMQFSGDINFVKWICRINRRVFLSLNFFHQFKRHYRSKQNISWPLRVRRLAYVNIWQIMSILPNQNLKEDFLVLGLGNTITGTLMLIDNDEGD